MAIFGAVLRQIADRAPQAVGPAGQADTAGDVTRDVFADVGQVGAGLAPLAASLVACEARQALRRGEQPPAPLGVPLMILPLLALGILERRWAVKKPSP